MCHMYRSVQWKTYLVMVRGANEYDWPIPGNIESATGPYFSEEYLGNYSPEHESGFVCDGRHLNKRKGR
jgi:hypothetical protein